MICKEIYLKSLNLFVVGACSIEAHILGKSLIQYETRSIIIIDLSSFSFSSSLSIVIDNFVITTLFIYL